MGSKQVYAIDIDTIVVEQLNSFDYSGAAFAVIPEPKTVVLLGLGGCAFEKEKVKGEKAKVR